MNNMAALKNMDPKIEMKRYGCAVIAAVICAVNINTFVNTGGLIPGGFNGVTLLIQSIFREFAGIEVPYTVINLALNAIPVFIGLKFIGLKFTMSSCVVILLSGILTDLIPAAESSSPATWLAGRSRISAARAKISGSGLPAERVAGSTTPTK